MVGRPRRRRIEGLDGRPFVIVELKVDVAGIGPINDRVRMADIEGDAPSLIPGAVDYVQFATS
jgi:hypothetical protein